MFFYKLAMNNLKIKLETNSIYSDAKRKKIPTNKFNQGGKRLPKTVRLQ